MAWIDVIHGYINENTIEYVESKNLGSRSFILLHLISGKTIEVEGQLARDIAEYARRNKVQFVEQLYNPVDLRGDTL